MFSPFPQLTPRILEAYQNVAQLPLMAAILKFLQIWQALPDFGISYFMVRLEHSAASVPSWQYYAY